MAGLSLIVVMVINIIGPVAPSLYYYYMTLKRQRHAEQGETATFMTQEEMNNVFMGPEFKVSCSAPTCHYHLSLGESLGVFVVALTSQPAEWG